ncbi:hypothetical protein H5410_004677 [Solanum commersonii]|uniref:Uncharacterized protein n=1 Tax=Solanum commersonii TaxID=4109 RepID=A0A9J6B8B9_SOLCO|nr:hypothetical protein H5410_004677 [Solanum commersonii]
MKIFYVRTILESRRTVAGIIITEDGRAVIEKEQCECEKKSNANRGPTYTVNGIRFTGGENGVDD